MQAALDRDKAQLYQLIVSQLVDDGFPQAAFAVSQVAGVPMRDCTERAHLAFLVDLGKTTEKDRGLVYNPDLDDPMEEGAGKTVKGIDLDEPAPDMSRRSFPNYQTRFITTHKHACKCAAFSADGKYVATGSADTSAKVLDVHKMIAHSVNKGDREGDDKDIEASSSRSARPVTQTFYDHTEAINEVRFHPSYDVIATCSNDRSLRFFDYSQNQRHSFAKITETHPIKSFDFHPSGDFAVLGLESNAAMKLYDLNSMRAYLPQNKKSGDMHTGAVMSVRYANDGKLVATTSRDGSVKIWDAVNMTCATTLSNAHQGAEVSSVAFSKNRKYLLTSGRDCSIRLWDLAAGKELKRMLSGNPKTLSRDVTVCASFSFNENYIVTGDDQNNVLVFNTRTGELVQRLSGHTGPVVAVVASPCEPHLISGSNDYRGRFWIEESNDMDE